MSLRTLLTTALFCLGTWLAANPASAVESYTADPDHSSIVFRVKHMNTSYYWGRFNNIAGAFTLDESNPAESRFEFQVKADSVDTGNAKRDAHIKSPDFLNAVQFSTIAFKSQSVTKSGEGYDVTGDLTLHGVTKPITVKVVVTGKGKGPRGAPIAGIEVGFSIKRSEFGMSKMVGPVGDDIELHVGIEGMRR